MSTISAKDGTKIYYKDWGSGPVVVFSHGWPLSSDAWEDQMFFLASHGYRCIAHDRRGHGRSEQVWAGNDMDTYADDLTVAVTDSNSLATANLLFQGGGFSNFGAPDRQPWPNGASDIPGTVVSGTITLATPIDFTANPAYAIFVGNGYANTNPPTNSGTWSNISITLNGVTETPASSDDFIASTFNVYPNPTSNILNVSGNNLPIRKLGISDINGRAIKTIIPSISSEQMSIDVSDLSAGVYLLVIDTEEGNAVKKFIKN